MPEKAGSGKNNLVAKLMIQNNKVLILANFQTKSTSTIGYHKSIGLL